jgi:two-component system nitrate/nitrite response regulator NarL
MFYLFATLQKGCRTKLGTVMDIIIYSTFQLFGDCLERCLQSFHDVIVLAVVRDESSLRRLLDRLSIDLLLVDVTEGLDCGPFDSLSGDYPGLVSLAMGLPEQESEVVRCGRLGFAGYVPRDASLETMSARMHECISGRLACPDAIAGGLLRALRTVETAPSTPLGNGLSVSMPCRLSAREVMVTRFLRRGFSNKEIARELNISVPTVKHHVHNLLEKLRLPGRVHVARAEPDPSWGLDARERTEQGAATLKRA